MWVMDRALPGMTKMASKIAIVRIFEMAIKAHARRPRASGDPANRTISGYPLARV